MNTATIKLGLAGMLLIFTGSASAALPGPGMKIVEGRSGLTRRSLINGGLNHDGRSAK